MKPVFIRFTDEKGETTKTFSTVSLKTGLMDNIFDIAERAEALQKNQLQMSEVRSFFKELKAVIVAAFGGQFTYDELNANVEQQELMLVFQQLCANITGQMQKN